MTHRLNCNKLVTIILGEFACISDSSKKLPIELYVWAAKESRETLFA